ncbi:SCP1.201-like deaminase [Actinopolyspora alba]|uniref:SCP1.201-like deaminase n=1 Tax=Actinopolyspora alba TaxID=673379 RepID=A0A1I1UI27_9ACTN|nr:DddA-like double-stranded DNA deaminase toxin [Actinopolyspora alba]SFD70354.1 SCP1.201-like deaminase [Actinopolyspora alba]
MSDSDVRHLANEVSGALAQLPTEQLQQARVWLDEYALPTLDEISDGSRNPQLYEAIGLFHQARELIDDVLALCGSSRKHLVDYLAGLGMSGDQPPPSIPHPSTYRPPVSDVPGSIDEWVHQAREELPDRDQPRSPTQGILRFPGSGDVALRSGGRGRPIWNAGTERWERGPDSEETPEQRTQRERVSRIDVVLTGDPTFGGDRLRAGPPAVSQHVETQAAMRMREAGITHGAVTINNRMCSGDLSCEKAIRTILPRGSILDVWEPGATQPRRIEGQA